MSARATARRHSSDWDDPAALLRRHTRACAELLGLLRSSFVFPILTLRRLAPRPVSLLLAAASRLGDGVDMIAAHRRVGLLHAPPQRLLRRLGGDEAVASPSDQVGPARLEQRLADLE